MIDQRSYNVAQCLRTSFSTSPMPTCYCQGNKKPIDMEVREVLSVHPDHEGNPVECLGRIAECPECHETEIAEEEHDSDYAWDNPDAFTDF